MAETVQEITLDYEEDGQLVREELEKVPLTKGPWVTILFRYRELDRKTGQFGPPRATLQRYQKHQGGYKKRDSVNLTDVSARALVNVLQEWLDQGLLG